MSDPQAPPRALRKLMMGCMTLIATGVLVGGTAIALSVQVRDRKAELREDANLWHRESSALGALATQRREELVRLKGERETWEAQLASSRAAAAARKAQEGLRVCNFTTASRIDVAVVTWDSERRHWMGHGWYKVANGECPRIRPTLEGSTVYLHGQSGGRSWGSGYDFCTRTDAFTLMDPGEGRCAGGTFKSFAKYNVSNGSFTWNLSDG